MSVLGDDDDIVLQAFREQSQQYKQVYEAAKVLYPPGQCMALYGRQQMQCNLLLKCCFLCAESFCALEW